MYSNFCVEIVRQIFCVEILATENPTENKNHRKKELSCFFFSFFQISISFLNSRPVFFYPKIMIIIIIIIRLYNHRCFFIV